MGALKMLATAETSDDLSHHEYDCSIDVVGAVGLATTHTPGQMALYRLKYLRDDAEYKTGISIFTMWTYKAMQRRGCDPTKASRLAKRALTQWLEDVCKVCRGRKHMLIEGTPTLAGKVCPCCEGLGTAPIREYGAEAEVVRDVHERANDAVYNLQRNLNNKLGKGDENY